MVVVRKNGDNRDPLCSHPFQIVLTTPSSSHLVFCRDDDDDDDDDDVKRHNNKRKCERKCLERRPYHNIA